MVAEEISPHRDDLPKPIFSIILDGLDPDTSLTKFETLYLKRDQFLNYKVMHTVGIDVTVRDIIKYNAHKAGGVHLDNEKVEEIARGIADESLVYQLRAICRVTLKALKPLRRVCRSRTLFEAGGPLVAAGRGG